MKLLLISILWIMIIVIIGCAQSLPPHEELNQAVKKSFDATGYNYASTTRITELSIPAKPGEPAESADKRMKYLNTGLDVLQSLSIGLDGAVDKKGKKTEALYNLRYDKDNVEVSVKVPLLIDYGTQNIYVGRSFFNTVLHIAYPQAPETKGKLIRIDLKELVQINAKPSSSDPSAKNSGLIQDLLQDKTKDAPAASDILSDRLTAKNIDLLNSAINASILKVLTQLKDTSISELPLTEQDRTAGAARHIRVSLNHRDSVTSLLNIVDNVGQNLFQEGVITKKEYAVLLTLTDKEKIESVIDDFSLTMTFDVGVASTGVVSNVVSQFHVGDKKDNFKVGMENVSSLSRYNEPRFTMTPEPGQLVDFKEILSAIAASKASEKTTSAPGPNTPDDSIINEQAPKDKQ